MVTMDGRPFDAVLCDLDGVIRHWLPEDGLESRYGLPAGAIAAAAFVPARLLPAITGEVTDEQWRDAVAGDLAAACGSASRARVLLGAWGSVSACRVDEAVVALLARVRRSVPVVLVSNATTRLEADLAELGLARAVDLVVNSARVGAAKPDRRIYLAAARAAGAPAGRCLFVDDR